MKIAIIGAGIFGCTIAIELASLEQIERIDIFEKNDKILSEASVNNQHRYHLGYHYPRSAETVSQILKSNVFFNSFYASSIFDIKENIYFIAKEESNTDATKFAEVFSEHQIQSIKLPEYRNMVKIDKFEAGFLVQEKGIDTNVLSRIIIQKLQSLDKIRIHTNREIYNLEQVYEYDFIINCSYAALSISTKQNLKYEVCLLPIISSQYDERDIAFTVMDGRFPSLYPTNAKNLYSLSHVAKTPIFRTESYLEATRFRNELDQKQLFQYSMDILEASSEFYHFTDTKIQGNYISYKVKYREDKNDIRTSHVEYSNNIISVLQGKITTSVSVAKEISEYVTDYINR